jgi:hypothetical protein
MTTGGPTVAGRRPSHSDPEPTAWAVVWIDSQEAVVARWLDGRAAIEHILSDVPAHRRGTGHIRHDPGVRHGGGGPGQSAADTRRLEHLARFLHDVSGHLPDDEHLAILGPGTVSEHLEQLIREADAHHRRDRTVTRTPIGRQTDRQLVARLRRLVGAEPTRRTVGAYRWTGPGAGSATGAARPRRVVEKPQNASSDED